MKERPMIPHGHYHVEHSPSSTQARVSNKISINTREMKAGKLHSGSKHGPLVTDRKQMIAISESQARRGK